MRCVIGSFASGQWSELAQEENRTRNKIDDFFNKVKTPDEVQHEKSYMTYLELSKRYHCLIQERKKIMENVETKIKNDRAQYIFDRNGLKQCVEEIPLVESQLFEIQKTTPSCTSQPKRINTSDKLKRIKEADSDQYYRCLSASL